MENKIDIFLQSLNLQIKNKELIKNSLTHKSYKGENNERLEFLGDAVIEILSSIYLYNRFPNEKEGILTKYRASLVKTATLAKIAKTINLGEYLILSKGEENTGGRERENILGDAFEAFIGAIFLDRGLEYTNKFLYTHLYCILDDIITNKEYLNYKSSLQEAIQSKYRVIPRYKVIKETGPSHNKTFTVVLSINNKDIAQGIGKSKQEAEENAAKNSILEIKKRHDKNKINKIG